MRFLPSLALLFMALTALPAQAQFERADLRIGQGAPSYSEPAWGAGVDRVQYERTDPRIGQLAQQQYGQSQQYGQGSGSDRSRHNRIHITSAHYGVENRACEAMRPAARACEGKSSCTIPATNRLCGDPVPGVVKVLTVTYDCNGRSRSMTRREGTYLGLRCEEKQRRY